MFQGWAVRVPCLGFCKFNRDLYYRGLTVRAAWLGFPYFSFHFSVGFFTPGMDRLRPLDSDSIIQQVCFIFGDGSLVGVSITSAGVCTPGMIYLFPPWLGFRIAAVGISTPGIDRE